MPLPKKSSEASAKAFGLLSGVHACPEGLQMTALPGAQAQRHGLSDVGEGGRTRVAERDGHDEPEGDEA